MKSVLTMLIGLFLSINLVAQDQAFTLQEAIQYGLANQPDLQQSLLEKQAADRLEKNAKLSLLPDLHANGSLDHYWKIPVQAFPAELLGGEAGEFIPVRIGTPWYATAAIESNWEILNPELWKDIRIAALSKQMKEAAYQHQEALLIQNITQAYYNALLARQQRDFAQRNLANYDSLHQINAFKFEQGVIELIDKNRIHSLLLNAQSQFDQSQNNYENSKLQLKLWMGMSMDESLTLADANLHQPEVYEDTAFRVTAHPQYRLMHHQLLQRQAQLSKAGMRRLPKLSVYAGYSQLAYRNRFDFFDDTQNWFATGSVGLRLQVPLFSRGQISNNVQVARYDVSIAEQQLRKFTLEQQQRYQAVLNDLETSTNTIQRKQENLALAQENQQIAQYKYDQGLYDSADLLDVQREVLEAQQSYLRAYADYYTAKATLQYLISQ